MKQEPEFFADRELILVYIAKRLSDALEVEKLFTDAGVDFAVEADEYHGGFLFRTTRTGAFFYVSNDDEERAVGSLRDSRRSPLAKELRTQS